MYSKSETVERPYSKADLAKARKLVADIMEAKKDPEVIKAAKEFYKYHTGKNFKV